jgi:hypothetical protein
MLPLAWLTPGRGSQAHGPGTLQWRIGQTCDYTGGSFSPSDARQRIARSQERPKPA